MTSPKCTASQQGRWDHPASLPIGEASCSFQDSASLGNHKDSGASVQGAGVSGLAEHLLYRWGAPPRSCMTGPRMWVSRSRSLLQHCLNSGLSEVRSRPRGHYRCTPGWFSFMSPGQPPPQGYTHTHTCPADAVEVVPGCALTAETSRGVHTQVPRPTGLRGGRALVHILQKRKTH